MSSLITQAHTKHFFCTMHQRDYHQKKHSSMPSALENTNMAKTKGDTHQPLLTQLGQDSKRALKGPMPSHLIDQAKSIGGNHRK
jgi:hypothetical protein